MEYTQDQLEQYLRYIDFPRAKHHHDPLTRLSQLLARQVSRVPFESFALHYSQHKIVSLDDGALFEKIVVHGKGGYCMELNAFFAGILRALGYQELNVGGRVKTPAGWAGWSHMVNLVTIDNTRYNVDVGFGSCQPMHPVPVKDGYTFTQIHPRKGKFEYRSISQHTDPSQRVWVYSTQEDASSPWEERNLFTETEFFKADYEAMNMSPMLAKTSFLKHNIIGMRGILNEDTEEVEGMYTLFGNRVKRHMKDSDAEVVAELASEEDRIKAIEEYFGVRLTDVEKRGIKGMGTEIRAKTP